MIKITEKPDWGQVLICVNSGLNNGIFKASEFEKKLKEKFRAVKPVLVYKSYALFTLECQYTIEEELYPLLCEYSIPLVESGGFIYSFAIFLSGLYTEKIILNSDRKEFFVNRIIKASDEQKAGIRKFYADYGGEVYVAYLEGLESSIKRAEENGVLHNHPKYGDLETLLVKLKERHMRENKGTYEQRTRSGKWTFLGDNSFSKVDYYTDGKGEVYSFEGVYYDFNPCYIPFEKFFFLLPIEIEKALKTGWSFSINGEPYYYGPLNETAEEKALRDKRDNQWAQDVAADFARKGVRMKENNERDVE